MAPLFDPIATSARQKPQILQHHAVGVGWATCSRNRTKACTALELKWGREFRECFKEWGLGDFW